MKRDPEDLDDFHPLLAGTPRWDDEGVAIDIGSSLVRIDGPPPRLRAILADCDGRTPLPVIAERHGPESRGLIDSLRAEGGVVDGEQAWRIVHRQGSTGAPLGRPIDAAGVKRLVETEFRPDRLDDAAVELDPRTTQIGELATKRRSAGPGDDRPATFTDLSTLLAAAYRISADDSGTVPSAGALYPLVVHLLVRRPLPPAGPGLWWYDPRSLKLHRLSETVPGDRDLFVPEAADPEVLNRPAPVIFFSADLRRPSRKYGPRGYRYALIEVGAAMQSAYLAAA
ncbi:MAG: nitroreductase family protein, partial [Solirubrobacterales bacterium]|nr:nitroreductase family protein [Solirubrobacterales bacterium]